MRIGKKVHQIKSSTLVDHCERVETLIATGFKTSYFLEKGSNYEANFVHTN